MILRLPLLHIGESLCYDLIWYHIVQNLIINARIEMRNIYVRYLFTGYRWHAAAAIPVVNIPYDPL